MLTKKTKVYISVSVSVSVHIMFEFEVMSKNIDLLINILKVMLLKYKKFNLILLGAGKGYHVFNFPCVSL